MVTAAAASSEAAAGDAANVIRSAVGHNFCYILMAQRTLVPHPGQAIAHVPPSHPAHQPS